MEDAEERERAKTDEKAGDKDIDIPVAPGLDLVIEVPTKLIEALKAANESNESLAALRTTEEPDTNDFGTTGEGEGEAYDEDCCEDLLKECLACAARMSVDDFCMLNRGRYACPDYTPAEQQAEADWQSAEDAAGGDLSQLGARIAMDVPKEGAGRCCGDLEDKRCLACVNQMSVEDLCGMFPDKYGCDEPGQESATLLGGAARLFAANSGSQERGPSVLSPQALGAAGVLASTLAGAVVAVWRRHPSSGDPRTLDKLLKLDAEALDE